MYSFILGYKDASQKGKEWRYHMPDETKGKEVDLLILEVFFNKYTIEVCDFFLFLCSSEANVRGED